MKEAHFMLRDGGHGYLKLIQFWIKSFICGFVPGTTGETDEGQVPPPPPLKRFTSDRTRQHHSNNIKWCGGVLSESDQLERHTGGSNSLSLLTLQIVGTGRRVPSFQLKPDTFVKVWTWGDLFIKGISVPWHLQHLLKWRCITYFTRWKRKHPSLCHRTALLLLLMKCCTVSGLLI